MIFHRLSRLLRHYFVAKTFLSVLPTSFLLSKPNPKTTQIIPKMNKITPTPSPNQNLALAQKPKQKDTAVNHTLPSPDINTFPLINTATKDRFKVLFRNEGSHHEIQKRFRIFWIAVFTITIIVNANIVNIANAIVIQPG